MYVVAIIDKENKYHNKAFDTSEEAEAFIAENVSDENHLLSYKYLTWDNGAIFPLRYEF